MKIGHISDIHWLDLTGARPWDFFNKRLSGGFNLLVGRARKHTQEATRAALETLKAQRCEHIIVAGDLTNLALPAEFRAVWQMLGEYYRPMEMTIVPGNHDFYTRESLANRRFERMIYALRPGNIDVGVDANWPFVNLVRDVAIVGLNSAYPRPWFVAGGKIGDRQLDDLDRVLALPDVAVRTPIVVLHHHLYRVSSSLGESLRNLEDRQKLLEICQKHGVALIAHGHNHDYELRRAHGIILAEAGSCSVSTFKKDNRAGKLNIYTFEGRTLKVVETWRFEHGEYVLWKSTTPAEIPEIS